MASSRPHTASEIAVLVRQAMDEHGRDASGAAVTDEELALLAEGRLSELPPADRHRVLRAVADDADLAELVAELAPVLEPAGEAPAEPVAAPPTYRLPWVAGIAWAAAACVALGLGMWRLADPPAPVYPTADGQVQVFALEERSAYWQQLERERLEQRYRRDRLRDYALLMTSGAVLVLSVPVVWWAVRGRFRHRRQTRVG